MIEPCPGNSYKKIFVNSARYCLLNTVNGIRIVLFTRQYYGFNIKQRIFMRIKIADDKARFNSERLYMLQSTVAENEISPLRSDSQ